MVIEAAICMNRIINIFYLKNWQGRIRISSVVRMQNDCYRPKAMNRTPDTTKQAIVRPEFQG